MAAAFFLQQTRTGVPRLLMGMRFAANMATRRNLSSYLVTPKELHEALKHDSSSALSSSSTTTSPDTRIIPVCASWFLPNDGRSGRDTYIEQRIPNARFFDLDKVIDKRSPYPHMLPDSKMFASAMSELGIRKDDMVVVYDSKELGIFSAPRVAWTMRLYGHSKVHILNNFKLWVEQGLPTESGELYTVECNQYPIPQFDDGKVASFEEIKQLAQDQKQEGTEGVQILDARPTGRFTGEASEPREGISSGHIPSSLSMPFNILLDPETKAFLPTDKLKQIFKEKGVSSEKRIISSCGTGVTACIIDTALEAAGYPADSRKVYDGSWTEWAQRVEPADNLIQKSNGQ